LERGASAGAPRLPGNCLPLTYQMLTERRLLPNTCWTIQQGDRIIGWQALPGNYQHGGNGREQAG